MKSCDNWLNWGYYANPLKFVRKYNPSSIIRLNSLFGIKIPTGDIPFIKTLAAVQVDDFSLDVIYKDMKTKAEEVSVNSPNVRSEIKKELGNLESFVIAGKLHQALYLLQGLQQSLCLMNDFEAACQIKEFITTTMREVKETPAIGIERVSNVGRFMNSIYARLSGQYNYVPEYMRLLEEWENEQLEDQTPVIVSRKSSSSMHATKAA